MCVSSVAFDKFIHIAILSVHNPLKISFLNFIENYVCPPDFQLSLLIFIFYCRSFRSLRFFRVRSNSGFRVTRELDYDCIVYSEFHKSTIPYQVIYNLAGCSLHFLVLCAILSQWQLLGNR